MIPLQSIGTRAVGWVAVVVALLVPGVVATVLWAPFLAVNRIRSLFATLPPTGKLSPTYVAVAIGASVPYVAGFLAVLAVVDPAGVAWSNAFLTVTLFVSVLYVVGLPVVCILGLPRIGFDWDPTGYGWSTWALLVVGSAWYATLFAVPLVAVSLVLALPGGY